MNGCQPFTSTKEPDTSKFLEAFKTSRGLKWAEHEVNLFEGADRFLALTTKQILLAHGYLNLLMEE
ncbi:MAG TPA: hypothetical protein VE244_02075 [Nitrososphaeraceae archaeon]|nr:hypothetical protein [Nitrososphaeraceae archaeon]